MKNEANDDDYNKRSKDSFSLLQLFVALNKYISNKGDR